MARFEFDAGKVPQDDRSFAPIPPGDYMLHVIASEMIATRAGTGEYLKLTLQVLTGPYANRLIWDNLNIRNQNADAERIANRNLADLMLLLGISYIRDTEELHFKPFTARVNIREDKSGQYSPQNGVRYRPQKQAAPAPAPRPATQTSPQPPAPQRATVAMAPGTAAPTPQPGRNPMPPPTAAPKANGPKPWQR